MVNAIQYLQVQSITSDEGSFYLYAVRYLKGNPERVDPRTDNSKMPIVILNTIPRVIKQTLYPELQTTDGGVSDIISGRYVTLFISLITLFIVYKWASELYGNYAGLFAMLLMTLCPNNLANVTLVTTDSYSVLFLLATMYSLWKFCKHKTFGYFLLFTTLMALSQLVKQSLFHLYIIAPLVLAFYYFTNRPVIKALTVLKYLSIFLLVNWFIINVGYYFYGTNQRIGDYHFMSNLFNSVQNIFPAWLPVPLPGPFVYGLDMAKYYDQIGGGFDGVSSFGKVTILGQSATGTGIWYYYFVSIFFKTPITYFILLFWAIIKLIRSSKPNKLITNELFLLFPVIYYLVILSFFYKTQCGLRHLIFIYPLLFIIASSVVLFAKEFLPKLVLGILSVFLIVSVFLYHDNYYAYTNEFIPDKKTAFSYVGAGNLEFFQANNFYKDYIKMHPDVNNVSVQPHTGTFLINTEDYLDIWNRKKFTWISGIKPFATVNYSGLLIKVTDDDLHSNKIINHDKR